MSNIRKRLTAAIREQGLLKNNPAVFESSYEFPETKASSYRYSDTLIHEILDTVDGNLLHHSEKEELLQYLCELNEAFSFKESHIFNYLAGSVIYYYHSVPLDFIKSIVILPSEGFLVPLEGFLGPQNIDTLLACYGHLPEEDLKSLAACLQAGKRTFEAWPAEPNALSTFTIDPESTWISLDFNFQIDKLLYLVEKAPDYEEKIKPIASYVLQKDKYKAMKYPPQIAVQVLEFLRSPLFKNFSDIIFAFNEKENEFVFTPFQMATLIEGVRNELSESEILLIGQTDEDGRPALNLEQMKKLRQSLFNEPCTIDIASERFNDITKEKDVPPGR